MPLIRNYDYYDYIDMVPPGTTHYHRSQTMLPVAHASHFESPRRGGFYAAPPLVQPQMTKNHRMYYGKDEWRGVGANTTIHDPTDFEDVMNANESMNGEEKRKKKRWKDLLFPKGKHSSRKDKENSNSVATRSLSSVSFRSEKPERSRRRESGSLSRHRYIPPPPLPIPPRRIMTSTSMGYSDDAMTSSSSHTNTDYEDFTPVPTPSYVIYPAASLAQATRYSGKGGRAGESMLPAVLPAIYLGANRKFVGQNGAGAKNKIFRSPTYHHDAFVNSHEWTLSRSISEMRLGIVGTSQSGKTALVHRYLTGAYTPDDSPEGGRFKKEVVIEGQSHLLLIRDEGQQHLDVQFCQWVDAVVFVFNVCSIQSYESIQQLAHEMSKFRNISDLPLILVGTKDHISEKRARVITEEEGRQLASQMKRCSYFETSSTYGTNVERVFKEACCKIIQFRVRSQVGQASSSQVTRTPTPTHSETGSRSKDYQDPRYMSTSNTPHVFAMPSNMRPAYPAPSGSARRSTVHHREQPSTSRTGSERSMSAMLGAPYGNHRMTAGVSPSASQKSVHSIVNGGYSRSSAALLDSDPPAVNSYSIDSMSSTGTPLCQAGGSNQQVSASTSHLPTPASTPNTQRKNRRISNIFRQKDTQEEKSKMIESLNLGIGRAIPIKQGTLYKKSSKSALNREWKKKYVCLYNDGRLTYHTNLKEYMDKGAQGKEMDLKLATIRITGRLHPLHSHRVSQQQQSSEGSGTPTLKSYEPRRSDVGMGGNSGDATSGGGSDDAIKENQRREHFSPPAQPQTVAGKKKRESRKAGLKHNEEDDECFEVINNCLMRWEFCAGSVEERDEWIHAITGEIEKSLGKEIASAKTNNRAVADRPDIAALRSVPGNERCADCGNLAAEWASINLGIVICIECSGIHRNLGTHISKVRGLELDQWPVEYLAVMQAIGNDRANEMWEFSLMNERRPVPESSREEKERFIERKYVQKCFLKPIPAGEPVTSQIISAVLARDVMALNVLLSNGMTVDEVNTTTKDGRTVLHLAASIGSVELAQLLIWNNADPQILDNNGRSCLFYARSNGFREVFDMLVTAGLSPDYGLPLENDFSQLPEFSAMGSTSTRDYSMSSNDDIYSTRRISMAPPPPQVPRRYLPQQPELDETSVI